MERITIATAQAAQRRLRSCLAAGIEETATLAGAGQVGARLQETDARLEAYLQDIYSRGHLEIPDDLAEVVEALTGRKLHASAPPNRSRGAG